MPGSIALPVRKREEKGKREEGKSAYRRGGPKSRAMPAIVAIPSKAPSPAANLSSPATNLSSTPSAPTILKPPPSSNIQLPLSTNNQKDPTAASPTVLNREMKVLHRKIRDNKEKDPPKTTIRKKKNSSTQSISIDGKTSSENVEYKSDGSKEPSENDDKTARKIDEETTKSFFQQAAMQTQKARKRSDDARLETMPESSQVNLSMKHYKSKKNKIPKSEEPAPILFKPNGDPFWLSVDKPDSECEKDNEGHFIRNPDLIEALLDEKMKLEERNWFELIGEYISCNLIRGPTLSVDYQFDAFAPIEALRPNTDFVSSETVTYNTVKNLVDLSENAIKRFAMKRDGMDVPSRPEPKPIPPKINESTELFQLNTCVTSNVSFNMKIGCNVRYDRHNPITSIRKYHKKMNNSCSMEQTTQVDSKEKP